MEGGMPAPFALGVEPAPLEISEAPTFDEVFRANLAFVWRIAAYLGVPRSDLDDVCQEVFVVVHRRLSEFDGRASMRSWLYGIARRVASDHRRRDRRRSEVHERGPMGGAPAHSPDEELAWTRALASIDHALGDLDPSQRETFLLYEVEELTMEEITQTMGCPLQTGYTRLRAARTRVRDGLVRGGHHG
jgi:RNA polymerase sigma-70 factor (ECF subfamily)